MLCLITSHALKEGMGSRETVKYYSIASGGPFTTVSRGKNHATGRERGGTNGE